MSQKNRARGLASMAGAIAVTALLAVSTLSAQAANPTMTPLAAEAEEIDLVATVVSVDTAARTVVLQNDEGKQAKVKVSDAVQRLDEIKPGDKIKLRYYESVAIDLRRNSKAKPGAVAEQVTERAPASQLPAGLVARQVTVTTEVTAIDLKKNTVTLKGPNGGLHTVAAKKPETQAALKKLKKGDLIDITYTEAMAAEVMKP
ncbi:MAG: hypothetical protein AB7M05_17335 [Alphaproteobacteria bacterium]